VNVSSKDDALSRLDKAELVCYVGTLVGLFAVAVFAPQPLAGMALPAFVVIGVAINVSFTMIAAVRQEHAASAAAGR
jgi:hypothetical protein